MNYNQLSQMGANTSEASLEVVVTPLRRDPDYIIYYINWFSFLSTGVLPMALLIYLNVNIYVKVVETR